MTGQANGQANAAAGGGVKAERVMQRGEGTQPEAGRGVQAAGGMWAGIPAGAGINGDLELAAPARPDGATQATPQRNRWGRIWPWALLWGAAPMPLYIWVVVGMMV
ncbi:hypothetical protein [Stappia sp. MMSF_3263]|uniref:hypothetical protein n=1 Tax=Stappia sp. MMSF_3263 TaxID=3046693 RepID=UPI00273FD280|nr:hypothetical protein [Stappia sp. MMSF_3263]